MCDLRGTDNKESDQYNLRTQKNKEDFCPEKYLLIDLSSSIIGARNEEAQFHWTEA